MNPHQGTLNSTAKAVLVNELDRFAESLANATVIGCSCEDWKVTMPKLNGPVILASIRAGHNTYDGKPFAFCPWCGTKLPPERITATSSEGQS